MASKPPVTYGKRAKRSNSTRNSIKEPEPELGNEDIIVVQRRKKSPKKQSSDKSRMELDSDSLSSPRKSRGDSTNGAATPRLTRSNSRKGSRGGSDMGLVESVTRGVDKTPTRPSSNSAFKGRAASGGTPPIVQNGTLSPAKPRSAKRPPTPDAESPSRPQKRPRQIFDGVELETPTKSRFTGSPFERGINPEPPSPSPPSKLTRTPSTTVDARQHKDSLSLKRTSLSQSKRHVTPPATPKSRPTTPVRPATPRLFPTPSNSESPQRAGVTKRMLGRTKTETSLPSTPSSSSLVSLQRTASFSSFSKKIASPPKEATPPPPLPPREPSPSRATHRTYAKSRSFLVALPTSDALGGETQEENDEAELRRESYTDLRARWGLDPDTEDENEANSASQLELKSISEMRHKGETRRFLDEVGYLFEGLDSKMSTAVKQNSAIEVLGRMCDTEFVRKAKATDVLGRTWDLLREANSGVGDKVLSTCQVVFIALVTRDARDVSEVVRRSDVMDAVIRMLENDASVDPLGFEVGMDRADDARRAGITKADRTLMAELRAIVGKAQVFPRTSVPSTRALLSKALSSIPSSCYTPNLIPTIVTSLLSELSSLPTRVNSYISGALNILPIPPSYDCPNLQHIDDCLRIIEALLMGRLDEQTRASLDTKRQELVNGLIALSVVCQVLLQQTEEFLSSSAMSTLISCFRLLVNLSNSTPPWCQVILDDPFSLPIMHRIFISWLHQATNSNDPSISADQTDLLCLALALLTNLVQEVDETKDRVREINIGASCAGRRECLRSCHCLNRESGLDFLVKLYAYQTEKEKDSESEAESYVLRGHIAVLLGLLCVRNPQNQRVLLQSMPGASDASKLSSLIATIRDFVTFCADVVRKMTKVAEDSEESEEGAEKLVIEEPALDKDVDVANAVIEALESLRVSLL